MALSVSRFRFTFLVPRLRSNLFKEVKEVVGGDSLDGDAVGKAQQLALWISHLAALDLDEAQQLALAVVHRAVGVDVANALASLIVDLHLGVDASHDFAFGVSDSAVVVEVANGVVVAVAHSTVGGDFPHYVVVGVTQLLSHSATGAHGEEHNGYHNDISSKSLHRCQKIKC